jgi:hypothetical protein
VRSATSLPPMTFADRLAPVVMSELLADLPGPARITSVVDIGAAPIDGASPYKPMLEKRLCRLIGF